MIYSYRMSSLVYQLIYGVSKTEIEAEFKNFCIMEQDYLKKSEELQKII